MAKKIRSNKIMIFEYGITFVDLRLVLSLTVRISANQHSDNPAFVLRFSTSWGIHKKLKQGIPARFKQLKLFRQVSYPQKLTFN